MPTVPRKLGDGNPPLICELWAEPGFSLATGSPTVTFEMEQPDGTILSKSCTISDASTNQVTCTFDDDDFDQEGLYKGEFVVTVSGNERSFPPKGYVNQFVFAEVS